MVSPWWSAWSQMVQSPVPTGKVSVLAGSMRLICQPPAPRRDLDGGQAGLNLGACGAGGDGEWTAGPRVPVGGGRRAGAGGQLASVSVPGHPELVAVALPPVRVSLARVADLLRGSPARARAGRYSSRRARCRAGRTTEAAGSR
jgi:hypothetical protein